MTLISNKWYYENTAGIILTEEGASCIYSQLNENDVCLDCENKLTVITMMEGSFISCSENIYHKVPLLKINYGNYTTPPTLIRI